MDSLSSISVQDIFHSKIRVKYGISFILAEILGVLSQICLYYEITAKIMYVQGVKTSKHLFVQNKRKFVDLG